LNAGPREYSKTRKRLARIQPLYAPYRSGDIMESVKPVATQRWWYLMPIIFITYSLAYLDRANYGFASGRD
jgi:hypothetical protein